MVSIVVERLVYQRAAEVLHMSRLRESKGYTATEAMTVVAVIGITAALAVPNILRFQSAHAVHGATWQVAGMLQWVRSRAVHDATPYLVLFQEEERADGTHGTLALIVRDADGSYTLTPPDSVEEFKFDANVPSKVRQYAVGEEPPIYESMTPPFQDRSEIALGEDEGTAQGQDDEEDDSSGSGSSGSSGKGSGKSGKGSGKSGKGSGKSGKRKGKDSPSEPEAISDDPGAGQEPVSAIATNGTTFPVSEDEGVTAIAFNERGIPVSPDSPEDWGSGAGAVYVTDNESAVYAAVVSQMGEVSVSRYDPGTATWK
jgi:uncharacterized membrane protein YgcG